MSESSRLTPQSEDFSAWYNEIVQLAELASHSPVRGCMVIRPYGYRIWELMQSTLDGMFKRTGHQNAYFPLFLPQSALDQEAEHLEGFAPQTAVVTHAGGKELEEPLIVRPTSEAIIWPILADWIQSYRDLPVLLNQWANVVRWEMRTRFFLRTTEFLWQEGHTAHSSQEEADEEARLILGLYREFMDDWMALAVVTGEKTESERFAGADRTYALESLMKDGKALQSGTSHNLGQNFARAFDVRYQMEAGGHDYVWSTSWGVSTRLVGAVVMAHGDDRGLILPPRVAPYQVVIVPIWKDEEQKGRVLEAAHRIQTALASDLRVHLDDRETMNPGAKYYEWERRGVPLRLEVGPRDVARQEVVVVRRYLSDGAEPKRSLKETEAVATLPRLLEEIQREMLEGAVERREARSQRALSGYGALREMMESEGGFAYTGWCGSEVCEGQAKEEIGATIRCIPEPVFRSDTVPEACIVCGERSIDEVLWARAY